MHIVPCTIVDPCWLFILYIAVYQFLLTLFLWNHLISIYETHEQMAWQNCLFQSVISDSYEWFPNCLSTKAPGLKVLYSNRRDMNKWPKIRNLKGNVNEFLSFIWRLDNGSLCLIIYNLRIKETPSNIVLSVSIIEPKIFTNWPFTEKFVDPSSKTSY